MDNRELAISLAMAESEKEIIEILKQEKAWDNKKCWRAFGDNENNWSTIGNQQSEADAALVEKLVNSVDALLMKECLVRNINPTSENAPSSIANALDTFFGITGGKIQNLTESQRTKLAQDNIILAATGDKTLPNYVIVDRGEGQTPQSMPDTILSINKSNKLKVPFVQGKFNMGGTGVLSFCGNNNFQLIISKRCPDISNSDNDPTFDKWGFTIVRRERPNNKNGQRSSKFVYLVDESGNILTFDDSNGVPIIPTSKKDNKGNKIIDIMNYGMYCKMFEYKISSRLRSNINMGLYNRLSMLLPNLAYPVYLEECRKYSGHSMFRTLSGLNVRLNDQYSKEDSNIEDKVSASFKIDGQSVDATVYVFKQKNAKGSRIDMSQYRGTEGVLLIQNGQTHGSYDKRFYSRNAVGLSYLADWMLTVVDCSYIDEATREELFMNSRDRTRSSAFSNKLETYLEEYLKGNDTLKQIQAKRRDAAISEKLNDEKPLEEVLKSVFKSSTVLSALFLTGKRLKNPTNLSQGNSGSEYIGKYNPTFFTIIKKKKSDDVYVKRAQLGRKFRIQFSTDAENDFFTRDKYPGIHELQRDGKICEEDHFVNLHNGVAILNITLPESALVGSEYKYRYLITDTNVDRDFENVFIIKVVELQESNGGGGGRIPPAGEKNNNKTITPTGIELPNVTEVFKEEWDNHGFTKESALKVIQDGNGGYDFFVNMNNIYLQTEIKPIASDELKTKLLKARYKYALVMIGLSVLGYYKNHDIDDEVTEEDKENPELKVAPISEMLSPILLPMIDRMGDDLSTIIS